MEQMNLIAEGIKPLSDDMISCVKADICQAFTEITKITDNADVLSDWIYAEAVEKNQDKSSIVELFKTVLDNDEQSLQLANHLFSVVAVKYKALVDSASLELPVGEKANGAAEESKEQQRSPLQIIKPGNNIRKREAKAEGKALTASDELHEKHKSMSLEEIMAEGKQRGNKRQNAQGGVNQRRNDGAGAPVHRSSNGENNRQAHGQGARQLRDRITTVHQRQQEARQIEKVLNVKKRGAQGNDDQHQQFEPQQKRRHIEPQANDRNGRMVRPQQQDAALGEYRTSDSERQRRAARFQTNPITQEQDSTLTNNGPKKIDLKRAIEQTNQPDDGAAAPGKKNVRCRFFPNCNNTDCPFVHPTEQCKYFPACSNGAKCLFLHPEIDCKFGVSCTRQNCNYKHPKGRPSGMGRGGHGGPMGNMQMMQAVALMMAAQGGRGGMGGAKYFGSGPRSGGPHSKHGSAAQSAGQSSQKPAPEPASKQEN